MSTIARKLLIAAAIAFGAFVIFVAVSAAALVGYDIYADGKADRAAQSLCRAIPIGSDIDAAIAAAGKRNDGNRLLVYEGAHHFRFEAGALHNRDCVVTVVNGRVASAWVEKNDD